MHMLTLATLWQTDPWGKKGEDSLAAILASQQPGTDFKIDPNKTYSEVRTAYNFFGKFRLCFRADRKNRCGWALIPLSRHLS